MNGEPFPGQMAIAKNPDMRRFERLEIFIRLEVCTGEEGDQNANTNGEDDRRPLHVPKWQPSSFPNGWRGSVALDSCIHHVAASFKSHECWNSFSLGRNICGVYNAG
jgi:hypothetical protein